MWRNKIITQRRRKVSVNTDPPQLHYALCTLTDLENSCLPLDQSAAKLKTVGTLSSAFFPRFKQFACFHFQFSLAKDIVHVSLCSDWSLGLLWFWYFDVSLKTALCTFNYQAQVFIRLICKTDNCQTDSNTNTLCLFHGILPSASRELQ